MRARFISNAAPLGAQEQIALLQPCSFTGSPCCFPYPNPLRFVIFSGTVYGNSIQNEKNRGFEPNRCFDSDGFRKGAPIILPSPLSSLSLSLQILQPFSLKGLARGCSLRNNRNTVSIFTETVNTHRRIDERDTRSFLNELAYAVIFFV